MSARNPRPETQRRSPVSRRPWGLALLISLITHAVLLSLFAVIAPWLTPPMDPSNQPLSVVIVQPPPEEEEEPEAEPEPKIDWDGQIVEIAPPKEQVRPEESEYLAEYDNTVPEETRVDQFKINPEILSPEFSQEEKMQQEDLQDLNIDKPSTGAQVGNHRFDPDRDGTLAALPSPWTLTNKEGPQDPVPAQHMDASVAGSPSNDLLDEARGEAVSLNTREFLYASYLNRIRRLVNFYWQQNLDNLPRSVRLNRPRYTTGVHTILNSDGALEFIEVVDDSGATELDNAVVRAFRLAGPFPNPPEGLIEKDGRVYLPGMAFTVQLGAARAQYQGIDPRAGVQYPGILKSPR